MRILDEENDKPTKRALVLLTPEEAREFRDALEHVLKRPDNNHAHISDSTYEREITLAIYTPDNLKHFNERVKMLIEREV